MDWTNDKTPYRKEKELQAVKDYCVIFVLGFAIGLGASVLFHYYFIA